MEKLNFKPVKQVKLPETVYNVIKDAILRSQLKPGRKLNQDQLANALKVSRTPVREALLRLENEQLVKNLPYKGAVVSGFSSRRIEECHEIRAVLEGYAAKIATKHIPKNELGKLEKSIEGMKSHRDDLQRVISLNEEFHELLSKASGNEQLYYLLGSMLKHFPRNISWHLPGRVERSIKEHEQILEAVRKGQCELAEKLMIKHLQSVEMSCVEVSSDKKDLTETNYGHHSQLEQKTSIKGKRE